MSDFVDYITDLINGVEGGSIRQYPKIDLTPIIT